MNRESALTVEKDLSVNMDLQKEFNDINVFFVTINIQ